MTEAKEDPSLGVEQLPQDELEARPRSSTEVAIDPDDSDVANKVPESALRQVPEGKQGSEG